MEEHAKKKKVRGGNRAFVTKTCNQAKEVISKYDTTQKNKLESLQQVLVDKLADIKLLDNEIIDFIDEEEHLVAEINECGEFTTNVQECLMHIKEILSAAPNPTSSSSNNETTDLNQNPAGSGQNGDANPNSNSALSSKSLSAKLPKLQFKTFSGNPIDWFPFWDSFNAAIHSNTNLCDIDKFNYLKSLLSESAADSISGLSLTSDNYVKAVELLQDRFGNNQVIISNHMELIMNIEGVKSSDVKKLRFLYDKIESHIRSLKSVGIDPDSYGSFITPIIMNKLPEELRIVISRKLSCDSWNLEEIMKAFREELLLRERCSFLSLEKTVPSKSSTPSRPQPQSSTAALHTDSSMNNKSSSPNSGAWCSFCKGSHHSAKCNIITDIKERKRILRQKGKCFLCLRNGHILKSCTSNFKCFKCNGAHHTAICGGQYKEKQGNTSVEPRQPATMYVSGSRNCILLQTARANVSSPLNPCNATSARIIFDSCSQRSYITNELKEGLSLPTIGTETLSIKTFGEVSPKLQSCEIVQCGVTTLDGLLIYVTAYVVPVICNPISNQHIELARSNYQHLRDLQFADSTTGHEELDVQILIGADFYWSFVDGHTIRNNFGGPTAVSTNLGWVLSGPVNAVSDSQTTVNFSNTHVLKVDTCIANETLSLDQEVSKFWEYESLGIMKQERSLYDDFVEQVEIVDGRYQVKLPFKEGHDLLSDNFALSKSRLLSLLRRLKSKPDILKQYDHVIQEQLSQGIIEPVSSASAVGKTHYLPHHAVIRTDKETTKLRVVYDASSRAETNLPSLNDCLYAGPSMSPLIFDILLRFRAHKIALTGDIEKAFLNISVHPDHRDYLRFLWVSDIENDNPEIRVYRFARVVFGVASSPFLLNATIRHHMTTLNEQDEHFVNELLRSLYVDDFLKGADDDNSAFELYQNLKHSFKLGGFNMRKWVTNSPLLKERIEKAENPDHSPPLKPIGCEIIQEEDQSFSTSSLNTIETQSHPGTKALGIHWDNERDLLQFEFNNLADLLEIPTLTKRIILGTVAKLYDPLGILSPVIILLKILFQQLCKTKIEWDTPLTPNFAEQWKRIVKDLVQLKLISVDRYYFNSFSQAQLRQIHLHGFADASDKAYGAVVYLRVETESGKTFTKLLSSRTRVAPINGDTIPRLELMSALILARLMNSLITALKGTVNIDKTFYWLDSQIALWWIWGVTKEFKQFVQNRVVEIRSLTKPDMWNYCPSELNPADIASRGMKAFNLSENELWWLGPPFLQGGSEGWPKVERSTIENSDNLPPVLERQERRKTETEKSNTYISLAVTANVEKDANIGSIIQCSSYSDSHKLFRVTSFVLRFVSNLKRGLDNSDKSVGEITKEEMDKAKILWYKHVQLEIIQDKSFDQIKTSLSLFTDEEGVLRCRGRIENAPIPYNARFPILLPRLSHLTYLIIFDCHQRVMHNGVKDTLAELRNTFWVVRGRQTVKSIISKCVVCKRIEGRSYKTPPPPPLPEFRLSDDFAFTRIGVDFAGPVYLRDIFVKSEELNKSYIALFTCASTRGVHLELVPDLTAPSFIKALIRFKGRRGSPVLIISDNGKTFKDSRLKAYCARENIEWRYNVERAPWWGGFFERLVKSLKRCLKKCFRTARLNYEEFNTALIEVEGVLNSRPLTYIYDEMSEPLTPSHLIMGRRILSTSHAAACESTSQICLTRRAKFLEKVLGHFWNRWRSEYLTELREYHRPQKRVNAHREIKQGDVVCIHEDKTPRQSWRIGKVERLLTGRDGCVRSAVVKVNSKGGNPLELRRPLQRLYPLEVQLDNELKINNDPGQGLQIQMVRDEDVELINRVV